MLTCVIPTLKQHIWVTGSLTMALLTCKLILLNLNKNILFVSLRVVHKMTREELEYLLRDKIPTLPKKARRVAEYLLSNMREVAFNSIGQVAEELQVSKAQLVRVARILQ